MTCQCEHPHPATEADASAGVAGVVRGAPAWVPVALTVVLVALGWAVGGVVGACLLLPPVAYAGWLAVVDRGGGAPVVMLRVAVATFLLAMLLVQLRR